MSHRGSLVRVALAGTLAGGAAGFALGLLLAPDEGRQLRRRVAYLLDRWAELVGETLDRIDDRDAASEARQDADALVADARAQAARLLDEADALMVEARQRRAARPDAEPGGDGARRDD